MNDDMMTALLFFRAAFPVMKVPLQEWPTLTKAFADVEAQVQFSAGKGEDKIGCYLDFNKGEFKSVEGFCEKPALTLSFSTIAKMNVMLTGGSALPSIKGALAHPLLLVKVLRLLMSLMLMMPSAKPKDELRRYLKVKMSLYMVSTALSVYNKLGNPKMKDWTERQPDRIYQFSVEPYDAEAEKNIAVYLRVKGGKSKAGRGVYKRRKPFVHFQFNGVDGALAVLQNEVEFVEGVEKGHVQVLGAPEYSSQLNDFMSVIQSKMT